MTISIPKISMYSPNHYNKTQKTSTSISTTQNKPLNPCFKGNNAEEITKFVKDYFGMNDTVFMDYYWLKEEKFAKHYEDKSKTNIHKAINEFSDKNLIKLIKDVKSLSPFADGCLEELELKILYSKLHKGTNTILQELKKTIIDKAIDKNCASYSTKLSKYGLIKNVHTFKNEIKEYKFNKKFSNYFKIEAKNIEAIALKNAPNYTESRKAFRTLTEKMFSEYTPRYPKSLDELSDITTRKRYTHDCYKKTHPTLHDISVRLAKYEKEFLNAINEARIKSKKKHKKTNNI